MTRARRRALFGGAVIGAAGLAGLAACGDSERASLGPGPGMSEDSGSGGPPFPEGPASRGVVLVHAASFPSFRLCFEKYPQLKPQPDSKVMPNANVVGVEVGSVIRIDPLPEPPGKIYVIDRTEVEATLGDDEPTCGSLICNPEAGPVGDECLKRGQDYDEIGSIDRPLGANRVELLAIAGCANGIVLENIGVDSSICGENWLFARGNLSANILELSPRQASPEAGLAVQLVHLAPILGHGRDGGQGFNVTFGRLAAPGRLEQPVAEEPKLFQSSLPQILQVAREDDAFYGTHGFRIALPPATAGDGGSDAGTSIFVDQSLAEVQDLSAPRDVPAEYYRAASNYALLLLGDPSIAKELDDGGPNPSYSARRGLHLLAVPILDPNADAGADGGPVTDAAALDGASTGDGG